MKDAYQGDNLIELELKVSGDVKLLRVDPAFAPCAVKILEMNMNGEGIPLRRRKVLSANGRISFPAKKGGEGGPSIVFPTADPNICIALGRLSPRAENILHVRMEIVRLPLSMAGDLAGD